MERAVNLSGGDPDLQVRLGEMYLLRDNTAGAWQQAERAILAQRHSAAAWALRGDVLRRRGDLTEAGLEKMESDINTGLDADVKFAEESPMPAGPEALTGVYAES